MAQSKQTDTLNKFTGTWGGIVIKRLNENEIHKPYSIIWRIHRIVNSKNQIELTEIGQRFESYEEIKKPKKAIYKGHIDKNTLSIEISNSTTKSKYLVKLNLNQNEEHSMLIGTVEPIGTNDSLMISLTKFNDDISDEIGPVKSVEVILTPPPPPKN